MGVLGRNESNFLIFHQKISFIAKRKNPPFAHSFVHMSPNHAPNADDQHVKCRDYDLHMWGQGDKSIQTCGWTKYSDHLSSVGSGQNMMFL